MRAVLFFAAGSSLLAAAEGHGSMYEPPNRGSLGCLFQDPSCAGGSCLFFNQGTSIGCPRVTGDNPVWGAVCAHPAEPTIGDDKRLRTYNVDGTEHPFLVKDWTKTHPWRYPGSAPVEDPCGLAGGWYVDPSAGNTSGFSGGGGDAPPGTKQGTRGSSLPKLLKQTVWIAGTTAEVAWGFAANHGGGYQYRLCPATKELTEACFQDTPLEFVGNTSWLQFGGGRDVHNRTEIPAARVSTGTIPVGSTWTKNPIPSCTPFTGGAFDGASVCDGAQFPPPLDGLFGFGVGACFSDYVPCTKKQFAKAHAMSQIGIVDRVRVPDLPPGEYVVSFRWDSEQTPQVWNQCGDVTIKASGKPSTPFIAGNGCDMCCAESEGICANCTQCINVTTGPCAYCHTPYPYVPVRPRYNIPVTCLGHEAADGGPPQWTASGPPANWKAGWSPGCPKCWADANACTRGERE